MTNAERWAANGLRGDPEAEEWLRTVDPRGGDRIVRIDIIDEGHIDYWALTRRVELYFVNGLPCEADALHVRRRLAATVPAPYLCAFVAEDE